MALLGSLAMAPLRSGSGSCYMVAATVSTMALLGSLAMAPLRSGSRWSCNMVAATVSTMALISLLNIRSNNKSSDRSGEEC
ncbi:unnamed protein product [Clonostachys solani]|uniref:Uncharacterized protein n=1 Tax=Clonostachys solani TaxID=160281 RepID=A0A9N9W3E9_9HYPO|nr:unnamed protein product [Clonostachys solani]